MLFPFHFWKSNEIPFAAIRQKIYTAQNIGCQWIKDIISNKYCAPHQIMDETCIVPSSGSACRSGLFTRTEAWFLGTKASGLCNEAQIQWQECEPTKRVLLFITDSSPDSYSDADSLS